MKYKAARKRREERSWDLGWIPRALIVLFFVLLPFVFSGEGYDKFRLPKTTFAVLAIVGIGLAVVLLGKLRLGFSWKSWEALLVGSTAYLALHTLVSSNPLVSGDALLLLLPFVILFFLLRSTITPGFQRFLWIAIGVSLGVSSVLTVLQYHGLITSMTYQTGDVLLGRINPAGFIGEVNSGGFLFGLVSILLLYFVVAERRPYARLLGSVLLAINLAGLAYTRTLTALAALSVGFLLWLAFHHWWTLRQGKGVTRALVYFWIALSVGLVGGTAVAILSGIGPRVIEVASQVARGDLNQATAGRQPVYWLTWQMIKEKPLLGRGLETFGHDFFYFRADTEIGQSTDLIHQEGSFRQVHNDYLQVAEELGLVGLALMLALLAIPVVRAVSLVRELEDDREVYWNGLLAISVVYVMIGALAFFPLRLTVTGSYVILLFACLRWYQGAPAPVADADPRQGSWLTIPAVLVLVAIFIFAGVPLYRSWEANGRLGTASFLLERITAGQVPARQKQAILGRILTMLDQAGAAERFIPEVYNLRGGTYLLLGEFPRAAENYELVAGRIPSSEVLTNLAAAQTATDRREEALELLRRALRYDPHYSKARQLLQYLESQQQP